MSTLKTLSKNEAEALIQVKEAAIDITINDEGDEEFWYQCEIFGLESELSGEYPDYDPEETTDEEILHWVAQHEMELFGKLEELKGVKDFVFNLIINGTQRWVNLDDFITYLCGVRES